MSRNTLRIAIRVSEDFENAANAHLGAYRALHPEASIELIPIELDALYTTLFTDEGLKRGAWDLCIFPTDWIAYAIATGALEDLSPWMQAIPLPDWPHGWPAALREPLRFNHTFYAIPWHDGPECLIYRKDLFDVPREQAAFAAQFGYPLAPPATWMQFRQMAEFFTRPTEKMYGTLFAAFPDGHNTLYDLLLQAWSRGAELYDSDGYPTLDTPELAEGLDFYREIIKDPAACFPGCASIDSVQSGAVFVENTIALMANWFGFAARCNRPGSPLANRVGLAPIPGGKPGQTASLSNYWVIGIGSGSTQKQAAYDLLCHIASPEMDKQTALQGSVGVRLSTWNDAEVQQRIPIYAQLEGLTAHARTLPFKVRLPELAHLADEIVSQALQTGEPSRTILRRAQQKAKAAGLRLD